MTEQPFKYDTLPLEEATISNMEKSASWENHSCSGVLRVMPTICPEGDRHAILHTVRDPEPFKKSTSILTQGGIACQLKTRSRG